MDCEQAKDQMLDELYGELGRAAQEALAEHRRTCASCEETWQVLSSGKKFAALSEPTAPPGLEERILAAALAEFDAHAIEPVPASAPVVKPSAVGNVISLAGRWAMRPQARMAAVFLLMFGSSALLLRRGYGSRDATRSISVSEEGAPGAAAAPVAAAAAKEGASEKVFGGAIGESVHGPTRGAGGVAPPAPVAPAGAPFAPNDSADEVARARVDQGAPPSAEAKKSESVERDVALASARKGDCSTALPMLDGRSGDADASLAAARCVKQMNGCSSAVSRFEQLAATARDPQVNAEATLEAGLCQRQLGFLDAALKRFQALALVPSHAARANQEIETTKAALRRRAADSAAGASPAATAVAKPAAPK
jgi:hypothetical protein